MVRANDYSPLRAAGRAHDDEPEEYDQARHVDRLGIVVVSSGGFIGIGDPTSVMEKEQGPNPRRPSVRRND